MATCPYCFGALTDDHRCRKRRRTRLIQIAAFGAAGGAAGFITMALIDPAQRSTHLDIWVVAVSALVAIGFHRLLTRAQ